MRPAHKNNLISGREAAPDRRFSLAYYCISNRVISAWRRRHFVAGTSLSMAH